MLRGSTSEYGLMTDFAILAAFTAVFTLVAARMYPRLTI